MASTSAVSVIMPLTRATNKRVVPSSVALFRPMQLKPSKALATSKSNARFDVRASCSFKEKAVTGLMAAALTSFVVIPQVAMAAGPGVSPSLENFFLSIVAGGVVLTAIIGAVIGVSNFDPVKRS